MSQANVQSLAAMREFRVKMLEFTEAANDVLASLQHQIYSFLDWIEHDRPIFWKQYMLRSFDYIAESRVELEQCLMRQVGDHRPTCYEEKLALQAAKQRLAMAQEKVEAVTRWANVVRHEIDEHEARRGGLQRFVESDLARSIATLSRMIAAIEMYAELEAGVEAAAPPPAPASITI